MLKLAAHKHTSLFRSPGGTSRGVLHSKDSWILQIWDDQNPDTIGLGEVSVIAGLSIDPIDQIESKLLEISNRLNEPDLIASLVNYPAIQFGVECALLDLHAGGKQVLFVNNFTLGKKPISINGLIWMGSINEMKYRISEKLEQGFTCIKIKIGALDFSQELNLIKQIREQFTANQIEIRLDANGAFSAGNAAEKLAKLAEFDIHSIEQPIRQNQWTEMAKLCALNIIPIALDEELIGIHGIRERQLLLETIAPQYIILKPSLLGGFNASDEWITIAEKLGIGWWATSALETNIGLNAIAQWVADKENSLPQGLGTGQLFSNNFLSSLEIKKGHLWMDRMR